MDINRYIIVYIIIKVKINNIKIEIYIKIKINRTTNLIIINKKWINELNVVMYISI